MVNISNISWNRRTRENLLVKIDIDFTEFLWKIIEKNSAISKLWRKSWNRFIGFSQYDVLKLTFMYHVASHFQPGLIVIDSNVSKPCSNWIFSHAIGLFLVLSWAKLSIIFVLNDRYRWHLHSFRILRLFFRYHGTSVLEWLAESLDFIVFGTWIRGCGCKSELLIILLYFFGRFYFSLKLFLIVWRFGTGSDRQSTHNNYLRLSIQCVFQ